MLNVVIPIIDNIQKYRDLLFGIVGSDQINVLIGVTSSLKSKLNNFEEHSDNVSILEYTDDSTKESIINSLQRFIPNGAVMIMRKPITVEEFHSFIKNKKDIVVCESNDKPVKRFFKIIWQKMLQLFLGLKEYNGDSSVILFNENISSVLYESNDLSYASRVDRWRGLEQGSVKVDGPPAKVEIDKKSILINSIIAVLSIVIGVIITVCVSLFASMSIIVGLLLFCLDAICLSISLVMCVLIAFNILVGKKHFPNAVLVTNVDDYFNEEYQFEPEDIEYEESEDDSDYSDDSDDI